MHSGVGPVSKSDIELAKIFKGIVYAMHVGILPEAQQQDATNEVQIKEFKVW